MRFALMGTVLVPLIATMSIACSSGTKNETGCLCPTTISSVTLQFHCDPTSQPVLTLDGPCMQNGYLGTTADGVRIPIIAGTDAGTCRASLSLTTGEMFSTEIVFVKSSTLGLSTDAGTWIIDNACPDAGASD